MNFFQHISRHTLLRAGLLFSFVLLAGQGCLSVTDKPPETTGPGGMFVSLDKGDSWQPISRLPQPDGIKNISSASVYRLIEDPQDPRALYWASREAGMFYSYDDGKTWQQPEGPLAQGFVYNISVHPADKCTIYATNGILVYRSTDCNRSWEEVYRESRADRIVSLTFHQFDPYTIYMAKNSGDVLKSEDGGGSWQVLRRFGTRLQGIYPDPHQERVLYVVSREQGIYRTTNGGESWALIRTQFDKFKNALEFRRFVFHPTKTNVLYWVSTYGILVSEDAGETWRAMQLITPPGAARIYGFDVSAQNDKEMYYTATVNNRSVLYKSEDGGDTWITRKLPSGQIPTALRVHPERGELVYIGFTIPPKE